MTPPSPEWVEADEDDDTRVRSTFDRADNTARLALEVADLKRQLASLTAERDEARERRDDAHRARDREEDLRLSVADDLRAAEAEVHDLRAKVAAVEALAEKWIPKAPRIQFLPDGSVAESLGEMYAKQVRAALANPEVSRTSNVDLLAALQSSVAKARESRATKAASVGRTEPGTAHANAMNPYLPVGRTEPEPQTCTYLVHTFTDGETPFRCYAPATHEWLDLTGKWVPVCDPHGRGLGVPEDRLRPLGRTEPEGAGSCHVEIGGQRMTEAQFDAARRPFLDGVASRADAERLREVWGRSDWDGSDDSMHAAPAPEAGGE